MADKLKFEVDIDGDGDPDVYVNTTLSSVKRWFTTMVGSIIAAFAWCFSRR